MKLLMFFLAVFLFACNQNRQAGKLVSKPKAATTNYIDTQEQHEEQIIGKKFFDYDAIDYYTIILDDSEVSQLSSNQSRSKIDSFKMGVIRGNIPNDIHDLSFFIDRLERIGYQKTSIAPSKFKSIDSIFVEKTVTENAVYACIRVYRDILIFKKSNKVVGTAKICFHCMAHQIKGTTANTRNFGKDGDYESLEALLRK